MFIQYNEFELLELFEKEPVSVFDDESGVFIYSKDDNLGFHLVMLMSVYECKCSIGLSYTKYKTSIFNLDFDNVDSIKCDKEKMSIVMKNSKKNVIIYFKPNYSLVINNIEDTF